MGVVERSSLTQLLLSLLSAVLVVVVGLVVLVAGLQRTSAFEGEQDVVGRLPRVSQPVVVTAPGMTELAGATVRVRAASAAASVPVFVGVGRADDVDAYLGQVARAEATALGEGEVLRMAVRGGEPSLPDPSDVDVWTTSVRAAGIATLTWPRTPGAWRVVVAVDGRTPPSAVELTWSGRSGASPAPALIAVGAVLAVVGLAALLAMRSGYLLPTAGGGRSSASSGPTLSERRRRAAGRPDARVPVPAPPHDPVDQSSADQSSADQNSADQAADQAADQSSADQNSADQNSADQAADQNSADQSSADQSSADQAADQSSADQSSADQSSADQNSADQAADAGQTSAVLPFRRNSATTGRDA